MEDTLAIHGGNPVRNKFIEYGRQSISDEDIDAVVSVLKGNYITTGKKSREFEERIAEYTGAKYAVAVSNGTAALHMACFVAGIEPGDEVIVPSLTFAASSNCILYCGGTPVFIDVDPITYNIDVNKIEEKITEKTKAIIPVDFAGHPAELNKIMSIAKKHNLIVIEDGAHSLGSEYRNKKVGSIADLTTFSFHPVKPITTGEGGLVVTNNKEYYDKMMMFRTHGITRDPDIMEYKEGNWHYQQMFLGYNYRITDIQCALGINQLKRIDSFIERRREIVRKYNKEFGEMEEVTIPHEDENVRSGYHIYVLSLNLHKLNVNRKQIYDALIKENIGINVHYLPVYLHPYYKNLGYEQGLCPVAENLYSRFITIPLYPEMSDKDVLDVIIAVKKVINYYKK